MKPALIDTDILSLFFRGHPAVTARFETYLADFEMEAKEIHPHGTAFEVLLPLVNEVDRQA